MYVCEIDTSNMVYRRVLHVFERYIPVKQFMLPCHIWITCMFIHFVAFFRHHLLISSLPCHLLSSILLFKVILIHSLFISVSSYSSLDCLWIHIQENGHIPDEEAETSTTWSRQFRYVGSTEIKLYFLNMHTYILL